MLDAIHRRLTSLATWPVVALCVVGFIACQQGFAWRQNALGTSSDVPDVRFGYTPGEIRDLFESWGADRRELYAWTQVTLDLILPLIYGTLFAVLTARLFRGELSRWAVLVPMFAALADLLENATLAFLAWSYDGRESPLAWVAAGFTVVKFIGLGFALVLLLVGGVAGLFRDPAEPGATPDPAR